MHLTHCILSCSLRFHFLLRPIPPGFLPCSRRPQDAISQAVSPGATYQCFLPPNASQSPHPISPAPALALTPRLFLSFSCRNPSPIQLSSLLPCSAVRFLSSLLWLYLLTPVTVCYSKAQPGQLPKVCPLPAPVSLPTKSHCPHCVFSDSAKRDHSPLPTCTTFAFLLPLATCST